ncbi:unnamed protein product [Adineta steineri]|uniref:RanBP2-type domain-containing protein n=1 Tax=Adineta steineri TaxID=433720 RepID=A0A813WW35_9BILA|nr:unnamed protein product [Adineta steineri]CAF3845435.1 unnamed protein product [Adineta steineri]
MSIVAYSTCRIQFISNDSQRSEQNYSDRSLIELRAYDYADYSLRALDMEADKKEIFNIPLRQVDQYKRGRSANQQDEIPTRNGMYYISLNPTSRDEFHKAFDGIFQQIADNEQSDVSSQVTNHNRDNSNDVHDVSVKNLLLDIHHLGTCIQQGDSDTAAQLASQLASKPVRLQTKSSKNIREEKPFIVQIQLDGNEYDIDHHGATIPMNVFQSTTVRELRAAFEAVYGNLSVNQYVFVNGHLAHNNSSMSDLNVGPNSLFILFYLTHAKSFTDNGPWQCRNCTSNNKENIFRCSLCSSARTTD